MLLNRNSIISLEPKQLAPVIEQILIKEGRQDLISPQWREWLIVNILLNISDQTLIKAMVQNNIDAQVAIQAVQAVAKAIQQAITKSAQWESQLSYGWQ